MEIHIDGNAAFTAALAIAAGSIGQAAGHHLRVPGIVVLLVLGVLLGPDVANVVQPEALGGALPAIVGFAVAIILFEGGMSLNIKKLRQQSRAINQLITVGALVSLVAGALLVAVAMGWRWQLCLLFGTLVIVTGPTVVTPLLRRLSVKKSVSTVLEAEGVLIDAVGAITAAVALELVVAPSGSGAALALPVIAGRLLFGVVLGAVMGFILGGLLRVRGVIPEGLENIVALGFAVLTFEASNAVIHESGIAAVTIAGLVVGNMRAPSGHALREFQEQLTVMLIGMLFVLLVADVRLAQIVALGWRGWAVAIGCIVFVRPLSVFLGTIRTSLTRNEKVFVAWIGPRGIVAAAVASLFGYELAHAGTEGGVQLRALVFLVIAVTVVWSAFSGGLAARALGLKRKSNDGWLIVGANPLGLLLAGLLKEQQVASVLIDENEERVKAAEEAELNAIQANALSEEAHGQAELASRTGALSVTTNEEVNYVFGEKGRLKYHSLRFAVALSTWGSGVTASMIGDFGGEVMFGTDADLRGWNERLEAGTAEVSWWTWGKRGKAPIGTPGRQNAPYLPVVSLHRKRTCEPVTTKTKVRKGTRVAFLIDQDRAEESNTELAAAGWKSA